MPSPKPSTATNPPEHSMLSFIPAGMPRSIAEYLLSCLAGAVPLFAFFVLGEMAGILFKSDLIAAVFLPVVCIMPIIAGAISTLVLEKLRSKPLTLQRGAMVGAASGFIGSAVSAVLLLALSFLNIAHPFTAGVTGMLLAAALLAIVAMDTVLGALGGALVVKFVKDI